MAQLLKSPALNEEVPGSNFSRTSFGNEVRISPDLGVKGRAPESIV